MKTYYDKNGNVIGHESDDEPSLLARLGLIAIVITLFKFISHAF